MSFTKLKQQRGFTIIELLIVIVIIGILAVVVLINFTGAQRNARNSQRKSDIGIIATQLQTFYAQNNYYPDFDDLNSEAWRTANDFGVDAEAFKAPNSNLAVLGDSTAADSASQYKYVPGGCTDVVVDTETISQCESYTLSVDYEGSFEGVDNYSKQSL
jgi:type IV pilus assembly protein PilA